MLLRNVFTKSIWDARRSLLGWTIAIVAIGGMYAAFWPSMHNPELARAMEAYPKAIKDALDIDMLTAAGYLRGSVYGLLVPFLVAAFAIAVGTRAVAADEEAGTLDLVLAHPVSRVTLAWQRFAGVVVQLAVVCLGLFVVMVALRRPAGLDGVSVGEFAATNLQLALFGLAFGALAFAIGAATGSRSAATWGSATVVVLAYVAKAVLPQIEGLAWARNLSPFHWFIGGDPLSNGLQVGHSLLLLAMAAVLAVAGTYAFTRRDVAV
jgi:ABC-2 type transport system permease protein